MYLCEDSGYLHDFIIYVGKDNASFDDDVVHQVGVSGAVVAKLMQPLADKGYQLFVDNWYAWSGFGAIPG